METLKRDVAPAVAFILQLIRLLPLSARRCLRAVRRGPRGGPAGEIPVCVGGVCEESVSQPAQPLREAPAPLAFPPHRLVLCHRAAFLHPLGGEDPHRDADQGHAAVWKQLQLALHAPPVGLLWGSSSRAPPVGLLRGSCGRAPPVGLLRGSSGAPVVGLAAAMAKLHRSCGI